MIRILILFIISVLPVFFIALFVYKKDKNKEPKKLLIKLFFRGALSIFLVLIITDILVGFFPFLEMSDNSSLISLFFQVFIGIALVEEFSKWIMLYPVTYNNKEFDELYDMIIYAVFVSLGFACIENILYVFESGISTGISRALLAVPGHACDGVLMGSYLGLAKLNAINNRKKYEKKFKLYSIIVPTIAHGIYDYCVFTERIIFLVIFIAFIIFMYIYAIKKIKKISSITRKIKYRDNYCCNCGTVVQTNYCPTCGRKNE